MFSLFKRGLWLPWTCHRSIKSWESLRWHSDRWQGEEKSIFPFSLQAPTGFLGCVVNSHFRHKGKDGLAFGARGWLLRCCWEEWEPQGSCLAIRGSDTKRPLYSGVRKKNRGWNSYFTNPWSKITSHIWASNRDKSSSLHYSASAWWEEMLSEEECHLRGRKGRKDESRWSKWVHHLIYNIPDLSDSAV